MSVFYKHLCFFPSFLFVHKVIMTQMLPFSVTAQGTYLNFVVSGSFAVPVKATPQSVGAGGACERPDHLGTQDELQPAFLNMSVSV